MKKSLCDQIIEDAFFLAVEQALARERARNNEFFMVRRFRDRLRLLRPLPKRTPEPPQREDL